VSEEGSAGDAPERLRGGGADPCGRGRRGRTALAVGCLVALAVLPFANVFGNAFVWDDIGLIERNDNLRWSNLPVLLSGDFGALSAWDSPAGLYRPVTYLTYLVDRTIWGGRAAGFHLTNLLFHATAVLALFLLARGLLGDVRPAWVTAAVFAVHPVHTESVTWISGRTDVVASAFLVLSILLYRRGRTGGRGALLASVACGALAMGAKETAVMLPLLLVAIEWLEPREGRGIRERVAALFPFFLLAAAFAGRVVWLRLRAGGIEPLFPGDAPPLARIFTSASALLFYLGRLLFPIELNAEAEPSIVSAPTPALVAVGFGAVAALAVALLARRRRPAFAFGTILFFLALVPASNLLVDINETAAERFLYLPSAGFVLAVVAIVPARSFADRRCIALAAAALVLLGARTMDRNRDWRDPMVLHADNARRSPGVPRARFKFAYVLHQRGKAFQSARNFPRAAEYFARAEGEYREALRLHPGYVDALRGLGTVLLDQGKPDAAAPVFEEAFRLSPMTPGLAFDVGRAYLLEGRAEEAFPLLASASDADADALLAAAREYLHLERWREAAVLLRRVLEREPERPEALRGLGAAASRLDPPRFREAAECLRAAIALDPTDATSMADLAMILMRSPDPELRDPRAALSLAQQALATDPRPRNFLILAHVYVELGLPEEALALLRDGLARSPGDREAFESRIHALESRLGRGEGAAPSSGDGGR